VPSWPVQFMCFLYLAMTAVCAAYSGMLRRGVSLSRSSLEARCFAGTDVDLAIEVRNRSALPAPGLLVADRQGGLRAQVPPIFGLSLPARSVSRVAYRLRAVERGVFEVGPLRLTGADPLGLFPFVHDFDSRLKVVVYPALSRVPRCPDKGLPGGRARTTDPAYEDSGRFRSLREYVRGDDTRRIHWKVSARRGKLHVLELDRSVESAQLVALELCARRYPLRYRHELMERAVEVAAALVGDAAARGQRVGLFSTGLVDGSMPCVPPGSGREVSPYLLELLARIKACEADTELEAALAERALTLPAGSRVTVVAPAGMDAGKLKAAVRGSASFAVYQVGASPEGLGSVVPAGVPLVAVTSREAPRV